MWTLMFGFDAYRISVDDELTWCHFRSGLVQCMETGKV